MPPYATFAGSCAAQNRIPPAQGCARYRSQGRLSSWFVRLCVKSGRFVTSGLKGLMRQKLKLWSGEQPQEIEAAERSFGRGLRRRAASPTHKRITRQRGKDHHCGQQNVIEPAHAA